MRTAQEIRESGAAWVSEAELDWLCTSLLDRERQLHELRDEMAGILCSHGVPAYVIHNVEAALAASDS